ncbi:MAG: molybdopterin-dependent oxidoreductase [Candidatus Eisenbacteria bacterium]
MSESIVFQRRDFLKLVGLGVAGTAAGCAQPPATTLVPFLVPPTDILLGVPYWYASTCRECPAGCGILVKAREGRAIKIEGNPAHPVNQGGLCQRGQAALQGLYDPDRLKSPMVKEGGSWRAITGDEALALAGNRLTAARTAGQSVALLTDHVTGSMAALSAEWAAGMGGTHLAHEPFAYETLREANRRTFGSAVVPHHDFARARMILSFGADFLETWLATPANARGFAAARAAGNTAHFVAAEPRLSLTASNADEWVAVRPGGEMAFALGLARVILTANLGPAVGERAALLDAVSAYTPEAVQEQSDVPAEMVEHMARLFASSRPSLAVAGGISAQSEQGVALAAAVNLLNYVAGNVGETVRFDRVMNLDGLGSFADLQKLIADMGEGRVGALVVSGANPAYSAPGWAGFGAALEKVGFKISLSNVLDETAEGCDLILPATHSLESLDDAEPARGIRSIVQPAMQKLPMFDARPAGDTLIAMARAAGAGAAWPGTYAEYLKARWKGRLSGEFDVAWADLLKNGGEFGEAAASPVRWSGAPAFVAPQFKGAGDLALVLFASPNLYDGRGANKAWLQELPDPTTKAVWGTWVELHPDTAAKLGVKMGDAVKLTTENGSLEVPAYVWRGVRPDVAAVPLGNGHTSYGRFARNVGVNALSLLSPAQDAASGALAYLGTRVQATKGTNAAVLSVTQSEKQQHDRRIAQVIPISALMGMGASAGHGAAPATGHGAAATGHGGGHHVIYPMAEVAGRHTEPRVGADTAQVPAHAVTAFEP